MDRIDNFINLDRRFRILDPQKKQEDAALESYAAAFLGHESGLDWKELLDHRLVVVLGEPGSGKTREFRERVKLLKANGDVAFFLPLDSLITQTIESILSPDENKQFNKWKRTNVKATFFLDSVDEAKFRKSSDFLAALDRFRNSIEPQNLTRISLLISSRISEWQPQSDAAELIARFPPPPHLDNKGQDPATHNQDDETKKRDMILIVQIEPLDKSRVEKFTHAKGVFDTHSFICEIDNGYAWGFTRRPIDVIDLLNYWNTYHKIGTLTELIENDLTHKLKETTAREKEDKLSPLKARQGAEALGAAVAFCRNFNFSVPDDAYIAENTAIDSSKCLPEDWQPSERRALLNRAIFDSASYGRIRFHSRRIAEYLAAAWLTTRMQEGCSVPILHDLLFAHVGSKRMTRPSLAPVAAWLCNGEAHWNEEIRSYVLETAPWIHLQYGDPCYLPLEYKRELLNKMVELYTERERLWIYSEPESLRRLADAGLANDVSAIIRKKDISPDLRSEMLLLVRHGRMTGCLDAVLDICDDPEESDDLKLYAIAAVRDIGDPSHRRRLFDISNKYTKMSTKVCAYLCEALYPKVIDAEGLRDLLYRSDDTPRYAVDLPYYLKTHLESVFSPGTSYDLLRHLVELSQTPPFISHNNKDTVISAKFYWLGKIVSIVVVALLRKPHLTESEAEIASRALWLLSHFQRHSEMNQKDLPVDLDNITSRHSFVRRLYLWLLVQESRERRNHEPMHFFQLFRSYEVLKPIPEDIEWLTDDISKRDELCDQKLALRLSIDLWYTNGCKWLIRRKICQAVAGNVDLLKLYRELVRNSFWKRAKRFWHRHFGQTIGASWWWQNKYYRMQRLWRWVLEQKMLIFHINQLTSGTEYMWLSDLVGEASEKDSHQRWTPYSWTSLYKKRGRLIAWATKMGCKRAWRRFSPQLPHEKPDPAKTDRRVIVGLSGLQAAVADGELIFDSTGRDETLLAIRYAVNELTGFAPWLSELAQKQPDAVRDVLSECIRGEWLCDATRPHFDGVITKLMWHGNGLTQLIKDTVLQQLQSGDPPNMEVLGMALTLLVRCPDPAMTILTEMASNRIRQYNTNSQGFIIWLALWIQLDAEAAISFLQDILWEALDADLIMIRLCSALHYDHHERLPLLSTPDYASPERLRTFIPLVYRHIRPGEDIDRAGRTYSPTARDRAQEFRGNLIAHLQKSENREADTVLRELLHEPTLAHLHDYMLHLLDKRAEQQADSAPWTPEDIRSFVKDYEVDPKTDCDLFTIVCRRLEEIKHEVEISDISIRAEMYREYDEDILRTWFARKLRDRSRKRYTIPQEEEIDRAERPDLRVENPKTGPISIEIKWAENYSLPDLLERLENQLIGQYLRDNNAHYGIYLICYIGKANQMYWIDPVNHKRLSFRMVISAIEERARIIVQGNRNVDNIHVISIDFTAPKRSK